MKFKVIVREDLEDGGYNVSCPALPGCHSQGETIQEALENIKEAIECYLESLEKDNLPIPVEPRVEVMEVIV
ncbi:MAG TPA: type II toxin-antitoxin system HicB family antitoxin [Deltaproteobacteria bacterium]|nr:type II toxin-antitoxin system HicB family antitoxin [Deltaproteobacteria bacterium]